VEEEWSHGNIYGRIVGDGRKGQRIAGKKRVRGYWERKEEEGWMRKMNEERKRGRGCEEGEGEEEEENEWRERRRGQE